MSQLQTLSQMKPILAVAGLLTAVVVAVVVVTGHHTLSWVCHPCLLPCLKVGLLFSRRLFMQEFGAAPVVLIA